MKALLVGSVLFLLAALGLERLRGVSSPTDPLRPERLLELPRGEGNAIAALTLSGGEFGGELCFVRAKGLWRSREAFGAVCRNDAVETLIGALTTARGLAFGGDPARYGLGDDARLEIRLHGSGILERPDRHVLAGVELGRSGEGRAFARRSGAAAILEIDRDPRRELAHPPGIPPLVDLHLLAGATGAGFVGFRRMFLDYADGQGFELASEPAAREGELPRWFVVREGRRDEAIVWRVGGYTSVWIRAEARGFASPKQAPELGLERPWLRLTLVPSDGEPIELALGELAPSREGWLWNRRSNVLMRVDAELWSTIAARPEHFLDPALENPWERWLVR